MKKWMFRVPGIYWRCKVTFSDFYVFLDVDFVCPNFPKRVPTLLTMADEPWVLQFWKKNLQNRLKSTEEFIQADAHFLGTCMFLISPISVKCQHVSTDTKNVSFLRIFSRLLNEIFVWNCLSFLKTQRGDTPTRLETLGLWWQCYCWS